jgi:ligand-binding sensor domain-containing protein
MGITTEAISIAVDPLNPNVYVGGDAGLYRSYDGRVWRLVAPALADQTVLALLAQAAPPGSGGSVLYLGTTRGVYRSLDNGAKVQGSEAATPEGRAWGVGLENVSVTALLADPTDPGRLYAGTAYRGVYQSVDWGFTWQAVGPAEVAGDVVEEMAWGPRGELFVAAAGGVWVGVKE